MKRSHVVRRYKQQKGGACDFLCRCTLALARHPRGIEAWIKNVRHVRACAQARRLAPEPSRRRRRVRSPDAASVPRPRTRPCEPAKRCVHWVMVGSVAGDGGRRPHPARCHHSLYIYIYIVALWDSATAPRPTHMLARHRRQQRELLAGRHCHLWSSVQAKDAAFHETLSNPSSDSSVPPASAALALAWLARRRLARRQLRRKLAQRQLARRQLIDNLIRRKLARRQLARRQLIRLKLARRHQMSPAP